MQSLRIALNARVLVTGEIRGWSRYTVNLIDGLVQAGHQIFLFSDRPVNEALLPKQGSGACRVAVRRGLNYVDWEQRVLPKLCREHTVDIFHCPINYGLPLFSPVKKVLTLHDAIEKAFYDPLKGPAQFLSAEHWKMRGLHYLSQRAADKIITVSHHAKQDIVKNYGVSAEKITVIYEGADPQFQEKSVTGFEKLQSSCPGLQKPYFFYVGGLEKRKNIDFMLAAWKAASVDGYQLLIGGGTTAEIEAYKQKCKVLGIENQVFFAGYLAGDLLPSFYAHSHCFIYPSLYEGFGLQIVEAMQMGRPVICSNVTSLPEILGDPECTFNPVDATELAQLINKMRSADFHSAKIAKVKERRTAFSWEQCVRQTEALYADIL